jgi:hydrogenase nickel incorporation protein HypA/HybF
MSIAQSLIAIIREEMARNQVTVLSSVRLHIGRLTAIVPAALSFCFEVATSGTDLEGAKLDMEIIPLTGTCRDCRKAFQIEDFNFKCPDCGGTDIRTTSGQELSIVEMEVG